MLFNSNLYIITGGPGVGKTSLICALKAQGFQCVDEDAREIIKEQMKNGGDALPWKDSQAYTALMLKRSVDSYRLNEQSVDLCFFDRGIPDTLTYACLIELSDKEEVELSVDKYRYNPIVFILPPWKEIYCMDEERKQSFREATDTFLMMKEIYTTVGYTLLEVPKVSVDGRVGFILNFIGRFRE